MARRTLSVIRNGFTGSVGAGCSSTASARLAGIGGVFSMIATIGAWPGRATHQNVTF
jgi:hypothetical protein